MSAIGGEADIGSFEIETADDYAKGTVASGDQQRPLLQFAEQGEA